MSATSWSLLVGGTVFTTAAVVIFLYTLWYGLHRKRWLPLIIVSMLWLLAMTVYALLDSSNLGGSSRKRIGALVSDDSARPPLVEVNQAAG